MCWGGVFPKVVQTPALPLTTQAGCPSSKGLDRGGAKLSGAPLRQADEGGRCTGGGWSFKILQQARTVAIENWENWKKRQLMRAGQVASVSEEGPVPVPIPPPPVGDPMPSTPWASAAGPASLPRSRDWRHHFLFADPTVTGKVCQRPRTCGRHPGLPPATDSTHLRLATGCSGNESDNRSATHRQVARAHQEAILALDL